MCIPIFYTIKPMGISSKKFLKKRSPSGPSSRHSIDLLSAVLKCCTAIVIGTEKAAATSAAVIAGPHPSPDTIRATLAQTCTTAEPLNINFLRAISRMRMVTLKGMPLLCYGIMLGSLNLSGQDSTLQINIGALGTSDMAATLAF